MAKYTIEVDNWLDLRAIAPIAQLIEFMPSTCDGEIDYILIDAEEAIPQLISKLNELWGDTTYSVHGKGLDLDRWLMTAKTIERLANHIRAKIKATE